LAFATFLVWRLRIGGYGLALAALALVVFGAYDSNPRKFIQGGAKKAEHFLPLLQSFSRAN